MRVLIIHGLRFDSRLTNVVHSTSFLRHLRGCELFYANIYGPGLGSSGGSFDVGIVTYEVLALRSSPAWPAIRRRLKKYLEPCGRRIAFPQDDYSFSERLDRLFVETGIERVWSPIARNLEFLYPCSLRAGVDFRECLTGYWESDLTQVAESLRQDFELRPKDIGTRVRDLDPFLGAKAQRKALLVRSFANEANKEGFICDVGTSESHSFMGISWWRFLAGCRFTVGRRGGASIADPKGKFQRRYRLVQALIPNSTSSLKLSLSGVGGREEHDFTAISPRLFEAAALRVCQVLEEDAYTEEFEPWIHYLPLRSDLRNTQQIFDAMRDIERCKEIADASWSRLIHSDDFSYSTFVADFAQTIGLSNLANLPKPHVNDLDLEYSCSTGEEYLSCSRVAKEAILRSVSPSYDQGHPSTWANLIRSGQMPIETLKHPWCSATVAQSITNLP